jgi:membrane protein required for colicin V production
VFVNIGDFLASNRFDIIVVLFLFGMFVLGFVQGTIRRVLGIASMLFSFLLAANLRDPLGNFLASNWRQFVPEYSVMVGFGTVFVAAVVAFTLIIQGFYHHQPLFEKATILDELIGGILGVVQGLLLIGFIMIVLDSYFEIPTIPENRGELILLRPFHDFYDSSFTAELMRSRLIPGFMNVFGLFIPGDLHALFSTRS